MAFAALDKFSFSRDELIRELKVAGFTLKNVRPVVIEWVCSKKDRYKDAWKYHASNGKILLRSTHPDYNSIRGKVRRIMDVLKGKEKRSVTNPSQQESGHPDGYELFMEVLDNFDSKKTARAAFSYAIEMFFSPKSKMPGISGESEDSEEEPEQSLSPPLAHQHALGSCFWTNESVPVREQVQHPSSTSSQTFSSNLEFSTSEALRLYETLNRLSFKETSVVSSAGTVTVDSVKNIFDRVLNTFPDMSGRDKTFLDIGSGNGSLSAPVVAWFGKYIGVEIDENTTKTSIKNIVQKLPQNLHSNVCIGLANVLKMFPVISNVDIVYCYLDTMVAKTAMIAHVLEMIVRSEVKVFIFHSRECATQQTASALEVLATLLDPSFQIITDQGGRASEKQIFDHLVGSHQSCAHGGKLNLGLHRLQVYNSDEFGQKVDDVADDCYILRICDKFRQFANLDNMYKNEQLSQIVTKERNSLRVERKAARLDGSRSQEYCVNVGYENIFEVCRSYRWHDS